MKIASKTTSVRLRPNISKMLNRFVQKGFNRSAVINEALRTYLLKQELDEIRTRTLSLAKGRGIYAEEDLQKRLG